MSAAELLASPTVIAVVVSATLGALFIWLNNRGTERRQGTRQASSQEVTARAEFVRDLSARAKFLEESLDAAARREREAGDQHHRDMDAMDRRYRNLVSGLVTRERYLRQLLQDRGVRRFPVFHGWEQFTSEGGHMSDSWSEGEEDEEDEATGGRVLVLDDDRDHSRAVQRMLQKGGGWTVECFTSGERAVEALATGRFELALMDLILPGGLDGMETATKARAAGYRGPIIALSGAVGIVGEEKLTEAGFTSSLPKPVRLDALLDKVRQATRGSSHP